MSKPGVTWLAAGVTAVWSAGFALLARLRPRPVRLWASPGGQNVLVVAPHPDDEAAGAAGAILRHRAAGDAVTILVVTDGRRSRALGLGPAAMAARRRLEAMAAAARLDAQLIWLGLPEGEWAPADLARAWPAGLEPDIVYAPSPVDFHPEHMRTAHALAGLLPATATVRVYQMQTPLTAVLTNLICPIDPVAGAAHAALAAHASQSGSLGRVWRMRRYAALRHRAGRRAEPFWQLAATHYCALHGAAPAGGTAVFRGLRERPWADPLAYRQGMAARRQLLALAGAG